MSPWHGLVVATLVALMASGARMSYGVFVLPLSDAFDLTRSQAVLPFALSQVVWGLLQPWTGALMDSRGSRPAILWALGVMGVGFALTASAQSLWQLTVGYSLLVGAGASGLAVAAFSLLISGWFGPRQRGRAIGFVLAGIPLGNLVFAPLTSALIGSWGWRGAFLSLSGILILVALPLAWARLRDPAGSAPTRAAPRSGLVLNPQVLRAVRSRAYWLLLLAYFGCGASGLFLFAHLPAIGREHGFSLQAGANALGLVGAGGAGGALLGGWAADRFGRYRTLVVGYLWRAVSFFLLAFLVSEETSFYALAVLAGIPIFITITATQAVVYEIFGAQIAGRMLGLTFLLHQVGATSGPYFGGKLFESSGSYTTALLIGGGVLLLSTLFSWLLERAVRAPLTPGAGLTSSAGRGGPPAA